MDKNIEPKYRGMTTTMNGTKAPRITLTADSESDAMARLQRATDRAAERGEPFFSYFDLMVNEIGPRRWEIKVLCMRDAIGIRGEWFGLDGERVER